jgi:acyl carrier protein
MVPDEAKAYFGALGLDVLSEELGFAALEHLMLSGCAQRTIAPVDWRRFKAAYSSKRRRPLLDTIEVPDDPAGETATSAEGRALIAQLELAPAGLRGELAVEWLQSEVGAVLGRPAAEPLDPDLGFFDAGMDSITTVELKTRIESVLGIDLPATVAFECPTVRALAGYLVDEALQLGVATEAEVPRPPERTNGEAQPGALDRLSEDELLELLATEVEAKR